MHVNFGDTNIKIRIIYSVNGDSGDGEIADKVESIIPDAIRQAFKFQIAYNKITQLKGWSYQVYPIKSGALTSFILSFLELLLACNATISANVLIFFSHIYKEDPDTKMIEHTRSSCNSNPNMTSIGQIGSGRRRK